MNGFIIIVILSCPQIWNIEQEKHREKEKVGGRPAKLNEKKGDRDLEREIKNKGHNFFVGRTTRKFCNSGDKMRNALNLYIIIHSELPTVINVYG